MPEENNINTNEEETTQGNESTTEGTPTTEGSSSLINYNFERVRGTIEVNENTQPLLVTRTRPIYSVTFNVTPEDAKIEILISDDIILTGKKVYTLFPGEYRYRVSAEDLPTKEDRFTIADQNIVLNINLEDDGIVDDTPEVNIDYPEPNPETKYTVFIDMGGISSQLFNRFDLQIEYGGNVYTNFSRTNALHRYDENNADTYVQYKFDNVPEGFIDVRLKVKGEDNLIEDYLYEPEVVKTIPIFKVSPYYLGDSVKGFSNVIFYKILPLLQGTPVKIIHNTDKRITFKLVTTVPKPNVSTPELPIYGTSEGYAYGYNSFYLYGNDREFRLPKGYKGVLHCSILGQGDYGTIFKKINITSKRRQKIKLEFKPLKYKGDPEKFIDILGISNNNKMLIVEGEYNKFNYLIYDDNGDFTIGPNVFPPEAKRLRYVIFDGSGEFIFAIFDRIICVAKINEDNTLTFKRSFTPPFDISIIDKHKVYSDPNGNIVTFYIGKFSNTEYCLYYFKKENDDYKIIKHITGSKINNFAIPHRSGKIVNNPIGLFYVDNGEELINGTINKTINDNDTIYILNDIAIIGVDIPDTTNKNITVYPCNISDSFEVTIDESKALSLGEYEINYAHELNDKDVILITNTNNKQFVFRNVDGTIQKRPFCASNYPDNVKEILRNDYGNKYINSNMNINYRSINGNKLVHSSSSYLFDNSSRFRIFSNIDNQESYCISNDADVSYYSDIYPGFSKDGTMIYNGKYIYKFTEDGNNLEIIGNIREGVK